MTNAEAIEELKGIHKFIKTFTERGYGTDESNTNAMRLAIDALREKADKERRYVVEDYEFEGFLYYAVRDTTIRGRQNRVSVSLPYTEQGKQAAQSIADIYEGVKP